MRLVVQAALRALTEDTDPMSYHPYPNADRALRMLDRHVEPPQPPPKRQAASQSLRSLRSALRQFEETGQAAASSLRAQLDARYSP